MPACTSNCSISMVAVGQHPWLWSRRQCVDFVADFSDRMKRRYGVSQMLPPSLLPSQTTSLSQAWQPWIGAAAPELVYLEHAYVRHEGLGSDWSARLLALDKSAGGRRWRTASAAGTEGTPFGSAQHGGGPLFYMASAGMSGDDGGGGGVTLAASSGGASSGIVPVEEHKAPEHYFWTYRKRGLPALGLVRAIRNIASAHASDYVSDGLFRTPEHVYAYFSDTFPWLVLELQAALSLSK